MNTEHPWQKAYKENKFEITTQKPSDVVQKYVSKFHKDDLVLDIGSGNGRNSIFLATLGCKVNSFDIADLHWRENLSDDLQEKINFSQSDIATFNFEKEKYDSVVLARVIQYLPIDEIEKLFEKISYTLTHKGFLLGSFNSSGGIFNQKQIKVPKYKHDVDEVIKLLKTQFKEVVVDQGASRSQNVNYEDNIISYDIFAAKKT